MKHRLIQIQILCLILAALLAARLIDLQIVRRNEFLKAAEENRVRIRALRAPRGRIFDQRGVLLASNRMAHDLTYVAVKGDPGRTAAVATRLGAILGEDPAAIEATMRTARRMPLWAVVLARDVTETVLHRIAWEAPFLPGIELQTSPTRRYPEMKVAAHALGTIGEISPEELARLRDEGYRAGDWIGKAGIERKFDTELRGVDGVEQFEADPVGQPLRRLAARSAIPGADLHLSIDADLCRWANEALEGKEGAVAGIEPATGRVLCLASSPGFDPSIFSDRRFMAERRRLLADTHQPLFARAWMAVFEPGSTFKVVSMMAGLASGRINERTRFTCRGMYRGKRCWRAGGHGTLGLVDALAYSCNIYFYQLGEVVGIETLARIASGLGTGVPPGLGLGVEQAGVMPTPEWERANVAGPDGEHWGAGDLANTVIGQGYVVMSPLQAARLMAAAALGGRLRELSILDRIERLDGTVWTAPDPRARAFTFDAGLDSEQARVLRRALLATAARGTATRTLRFPEMPVGAKTGTAQNPRGEAHGWVTAVAPLGEETSPEPRLALAVIVVHGGSGSAAAGPVAKYILERWGHREGYLSAPPRPPVPPRPPTTTRPPAATRPAARRTPPATAPASPEERREHRPPGSAYAAPLGGAL